MNDFEQWIQDYLTEINADASKISKSENFISAGIIDSLGVMDLIEDTESHFSISLNENHFEDRRFPTIAGLAEIISEVKSNGS